MITGTQLSEQISRRRLAVLAAGAVAAWMPARAAAGPRIGFLASGSAGWSGGLVDELKGGLATLGWRVGVNCSIDERWADGDSERLPALVAELLAGGADVLVTVGTFATAAATAATTSVPIVLVGVGDPVAIGAVDRLEQPGRNATGLTVDPREVIGRRLQLLRELAGSLRRVAIIIRPDPDLEQTLVEIRRSAEAAGVTTVAFEATSGHTIDYAFTYLKGDRCDALYVASGPLGPAKRAQIIALARNTRLPAMYAYRAFPLDGGLISLAPDGSALFGRAATFVAKILRGAKPSEIPVERSAKFLLTINLKAARSLGIAVPQSILGVADEVIS